MSADPAPARRQRRPLTEILEAFATGAATPAEVVRRTGLSPQVVSSALEHLVRTGRLVAKPLPLSCPAQGCGACPTAASTAASTRAPVNGPCMAAPLVALRLTGRDSSDGPGPSRAAATRSTAPQPGVPGDDGSAEEGGTTCHDVERLACPAGTRP